MDCEEVFCRNSQKTKIIRKRKKLIPSAKINLRRDFVQTQGKFLKSHKKFHYFFSKNLLGLDSGK